MKNLKKKRKKEIKEKILKIINIISYVLSGLFIVVVILGLCSSCNKQHDQAPKKQVLNQLNVNVEEDNTYKWYQFTRDSYEDLEVVGKYYIDSTETIGDIDYIANTNSAEYIVYGFQGTIYTSLYVDTYFYLKDNLDIEYLVEAPITFVNENVNIDLFPRSYLGGLEDNYFAASTTNEVVIFNGKFTCNGQLFDKIICYYYDALSTRYGDSIDKDKTAIWDIPGYKAYSLTLYLNDKTNQSIIVHKALNYELSDGSGNVYTGKYGWVSETFRNIHIDYYYNESNDSAYPILSYYDLLFMSPNYGGALISYDNNLLNVFSLIGMAFTSFSGIFAIAVGPGLTIGTFLLIPLVALIVIAIIKLVKK